MKKCMIKSQGLLAIQGALGLCLLGSVAHADSLPANLLDSIHQTISKALGVCQAAQLSGDDASLPPQVLARQADEVWSKGGNYLLEKTDAFGWEPAESQISLRYFLANGQVLIDFQRSTEFNDLAVNTDRGGEIAHSASGMTAGGIVSRFYIGGQTVTEAAFQAYIFNSAIPAFLTTIGCPTNSRSE